MKKPFLIVFVILILDQVLKIWIKTHMTIGEEIHVAGNWFILHFTENEGMAFGITFGGQAGKLILSIFRIIAVIFIGYYIHRLRKRKAHEGQIITFSLIMAGALGNIIDSAFYGLIFSESTYHSVAVLFPPEGGYNSFLHGKVVDMFYFPVIDTILPEWVPFRGGEQFIFFRPVFNIADAAISIGVITLIVFQKKFYSKEPPKEELPEESKEEPKAENPEM